MLLLVTTFLTSCDGAVVAPPRITGVSQPVTARDLRIVAGQTIYVPAYSEVFVGQEERTTPLAVTLAVHNTDLDAPIIVRSVRYFNTDGLLVRNYIETPLEIPPLATSGFLVAENDREGGWGANFVVEWVAEEPVYEPVIEAIMVSTQGAQGISMISTGRVISQTLTTVDLGLETNGD